MTLKKHSQSQKPRSRPKSTLKNKSPKSHKVPLFTPEDELDLFHYVVDHIGEEVIVADQEARIVFVNEAAVRGLGYSKKNILSRRLTDFLEDKISVKQWRNIYFSPVKRKKKPVSYTISRAVKGGKIRTVHMTATHMLYKTKHYVVAVGRDITEQSIFEGKLKESEDRYRLLSEQAADGILVMDPNGVTLYANKAAGRIFKTSSEKLIGGHFESHIDKTSIPLVWEYFKKVKSGTPVIHTKIEVRDKKGRLLPVEFTASPIYRNKKVVQIHVIFRDISDQQKMEALIRESEKMKAFQDFIAGTIQEIQQPLKGLLDRSQSLIDRYKDRNFEYIGYKEFKDIMRTLQTMNDQVKYCFDITDRLNSLNRRKIKLEKNHCNANHVIGESVNMLKHPLEVSDIRLKLTLNPHIPQVAISSLDLSQALNNIVTNAIQSLPGGGGKIQIKTIYQKTNNTVRIDCQDDGVGIPGEVLTRVFDPFFTTKSRGLEKNSGLGLYIVHSIIKANKGEIFIKSNYRGGTLVTIILPVFKAKNKRKRR